MNICKSNLRCFYSKIMCDQDPGEIKEAKGDKITKRLRQLEQG